MTLKEMDKLVLSAILLSFIMAGVSGIPDSAGTDFMVMFTENRVDDQPFPYNTPNMTLYITPLDGSKAVTFSVYYIRQNVLVNVTRTIPAGPNTAASVLLPTDLEVRTSGVISNRGVRVVASEKIGLSAINREGYSADGFTAIPVSKLGKRHYSVSYAPPLVSTQMGLVAVEYDTNVTITVARDAKLTFNSIAYSGGQTFSFTLNAFQTVLLDDEVTPISDLSGTLIVSSKPIGVFSGNKRTNVGDGTVSRDHLVEQLPSVEYWGTEFITVATPNRTSGDIVKFVVSEPNTNITIYENSTSRSIILANAGDAREVILSSGIHADTMIISDKPIMVAQIVHSHIGSNPMSELGDPALTILPPLSQYTNAYTYVVPRLTDPTDLGEPNKAPYFYFLIITIEDQYKDGLRLNGSVIPGLLWHSVPAVPGKPSMVAVSFEIQQNDMRYTLTNVNPTAMFSVLLYGAGDRESYEYTLGFNLNVLNPPAPEVCSSQAVDRQCIISGNNFCQGTPFDNQGYGFVLMFNEHYTRVGNPYNPFLVITNAETENVQVNVTTPRWSSPSVNEQFTLASGQYRTVSIPQELRMQQSNLSTKAILVQSNGEVVVQGVNSEERSTGMFLALPIDAVGSEYYAVCYSPAFLHCQFGIAAIQDGTEVSISLPSPLPTGQIVQVTFQGTTYYSGQTIRLTLSAYDTVQIQAAHDLTGSHVVTNKPVSFFSGNRHTNIDQGLGGQTKDHTVEMLPPVSAWGKEFITFQIPDRTVFNPGDNFRAVVPRFSQTPQLNLTVGSNNIYPAVPNGFSYAQFLVGQGSQNTYAYLSSNTPVMLAEFIVSMIATNELADPSMIYLPPISLYRNAYTFTALERSLSTNKVFVNTIIIVSPLSGRGDITLDGNALPAITWTNVDAGGVMYSAGFFTISAGFHKLSHPKVNHYFGAVLYGNVLNDTVAPESYATAIGMRLSRVNEPCGCNVTATAQFQADGIDNDCDGRVDEEDCSNANTDEDGDGRQNEDCATPTKVDGQWSQWSNWGTCSVTCGGGSRSRTRSCSDPAPAFGGSPCPGSPPDTQTDTESCNSNACPVDGNWGGWTPWSNCSRTCGGGIRFKSRECNNPPPSNGGVSCPGSSNLTETCNPQGCPVNGGYSSWSSWSACIGGTQQRSRTCTNPSPAFGGNDCALLGSTTEIQQCTLVTCPAPHTAGTDFTVMFIENYVNDLYDPYMTAKMTLYVTQADNSKALTFTVYYFESFLLKNLTYVIPAGAKESTPVELPSVLEIQSSGLVLNRGVRVLTSEPVFLTATNREGFSADGFVAIPTKYLGEQYYTVAYAPPTYATQLGVAAVEDGTVVQVTVARAANTTYNGVSYQGGQTFSLTLNAFQTIQLESILDLTGTYINSSKPVAVFSGNKRTIVGNDTASRDHLVEQLPPIQYWGTEFVTVPTPNRTSGDVFKVVASKPDTNITITVASGQMKYYLRHAGDHVQTILGSGSHSHSMITADQPVMLSHFIHSHTGNDPSKELGDPSLLILPPVAQYGNGFSFVTPPFHNMSDPNDPNQRPYSYFLSITVEDQYKDGMRIDGNVISGVTWHPVPSVPGKPDMVATSFEIAQTSQRHVLYNENCNVSFLPLLYGAGDRESYGFALGMNLNILNPLPSDACTPQTQDQTCLVNNVNFCQGYPLDSQGTGFVLMFNEHQTNMGPSQYDPAIYATNLENYDIQLNVMSPRWSSPATSQQFVLAPGESRKVTIPKELRMNGTSKSTKAIYVRATDEVSLQGVNTEQQSTGMFLALPIDAVGSEYYAVCYSPATDCQFGIAAIHNGTQVTITLPLSVSGHFVEVVLDGRTYYGGQTISLDLNAYDTVQIQAANDLTGSRVVGSKPFSFFSGNRDTIIDQGTNSKVKDHITEMLPPVSTWGKDFFTFQTPLSSSAGDVFRAVTSSQMTKISRVVGSSMSVMTTIPHNIHFDQFVLGNANLSAYAHVTSDLPVMLTEFVQSMDYSGNQASAPAMLNLPPMSQYRNEYAFYALNTSVSTNRSFDNYIVLISPVANRDNITLDGSPLPTMQWTLVTARGRNYSAGFFRIQAGHHILKHPVNNHYFGAVLYGTAANETYSIPLGMRLSRINLPCGCALSATTVSRADGIDNDCDGLVDEENCQDTNLDEDGDGRQNEDCAAPIKVDGQWSAWSSWSACPVTCGTGQQTRTRTCSDPAPAFGGSRCAGSLFSTQTESQTCGDTSCPVDGGYSQWSSWSTCTVTCEGGTQERTRSCTNPAPANNGSDCSGLGPATETQQCNTQGCPVDGNWADFTPWSSCSVTCGGGVQTRNRTCTNPAPANSGATCPGDASESQQCNINPCPIDGGFTEWSAWGTCDRTCGGGTHSRNRSCTNPAPQFGGQNCTGIEEESKACNTNPCPVDGNWAPWGMWTTCNVTCGGGMRVRYRNCSNPEPQHGGQPCPGSGTETDVCNSQPCPIDGGYTDWTTWTSCSTTCGPGTQERTRTCTNPTPAFGGSDCQALGSASDNKTCNLVGCPVDGNWSPWGSWGSCSRTCTLGNLKGIQTRPRTCTNPAPQNGGATCPGTDTAQRFCNTADCPVDGQWSDWTDWGNCNATCGGGTQRRVRSCSQPQFGGVQCVGAPPFDQEEYQSCNNQPCPVDGNWTPWGAWSTCPVTCGGGTQQRQRTCANPTPLFGGASCPGASSETQNCSTALCPVDGGWSSWTDWGACTKSCGSGERFRYRYCDSPSPQNGGALCAGAATNTQSESESCQTQPCPINGNWGSWGNWSLCDATCGGGNRIRTRSCDNPAPDNNGTFCIGSATENESCNNASCPVDGQWSTWTPWSACPVTCAGSQQTRSRSCTAPEPAFGGSPCPGGQYNETETRNCNTSPCPINGQWSNWGSWSDCSTTCGPGVRTKTRQCNNPAPQFGGQSCPGSGTGTEECNVRPCPEAPDTKGSHFVLLFLANKIVGGVDIAPEILLINPYSVPVQATITTPGATVGQQPYYINQNVNLAPKSTQIVQVPKSIRLSGTETAPKGILVTASQEIVVMGINKEPDSTDVYTGVPDDAMGKSFRAVCAPPTGDGCQIAGVAMKPGTVITVTLPPSAKRRRRRRDLTFNGQTYSPGDTFNFTINGFESFQFSSGDDLTGVLIVSSEPIALFSGNMQTQVGIGTSTDHVTTQVPSLSTWGKQFIIVPIPGRTMHKRGDIIRIIASEDVTSVNVTNNDVGTLTNTISRAGNFLELTIGNGTDNLCSYIEANKAVMVVQISKSQFDANEPGDVSMILIPPIKEYLPQYDFTALNDASNGNYTSYVMVAVAENQKQNLLIDGKTLNPGITWCPTIQGTGYTGASFMVTNEQHSMVTKDPTKPFGLLIYGYSSGESYGTTAGMRLAPINEPCNRTSQSVDDGLDNDCDGRIDEELCGNGIDDDGDGVQDEDCVSLPNVDGNWAAWQTWSSCSQTCDNGTRTRTRTCSDPAPLNNGATCSGSASEEETCLETYCPIAGGFTDWSIWSVCSVTCGTGQQQRTRTCTNPAPQYGGANCTGNLVETRNCGDTVCVVDGNWGPWLAWSACSKSCESGTRTRSRVCNNPAPANGGATCPGDSSEMENCNTQQCIRTLGSTCTTAAECQQSIASSTCSSGQCVCLAGFMQTSSNTCIRRKVDGTSPCQMDEDCYQAVENSECRAVNNTGICFCGKKYYTVDKFDVCIQRLIDGECSTSQDCSTAIPNSYCDSGKCKCLGSFYSSANNQGCVEGLKQWQIAALVIGLVCLFLLFLIFCTWCCCCRRKEPRGKKLTNSNSDVSVGPPLPRQVSFPNMPLPMAYSSLPPDPAYRPAKPDYYIAVPADGPLADKEKEASNIPSSRNSRHSSPRR